MTKVTASILARIYGIADATTVKYSRTHVEDNLRVVTAGDDFTELTASNIVPSGTPLQITLSPYLLSLGATYTGIVEEGDDILVYLPHPITELELDRCKIRGYLI